MDIGKDSNNVEEFLPMNNATTNNINECHTCRKPEKTDRMKLNESASHIASLHAEEAMLKSLHRRLEIRIKRYLHRTRNTISLQEKLLNAEKCSQQELFTREKLKNQRKKQSIERNSSNYFEQIEAKTRQLEENIRSLCAQIQQIELQSEEKKKQNKAQLSNRAENAMRITSAQAEHRLHRMNMEMSKICSNNAELRLDIKRMLDNRRSMIEEYNKLSMAMKNATHESRQLTSECSESYANRRNLVARMKSMRDQHERDEKKLLDDIRELDRLLESNYTSKNFLLKKSNLRQDQTRLNELLAGKRSRGATSAYTAEEFRRLFRSAFGQDFLKEKTLNRTVETFLDEQEQSFALFESAVELINELDYLRDDLDQQRKYISNIFANDNIDSLVIKNAFSTLEQQLEETGVNVQSLEIAKQNGRELLTEAYRLIKDLFYELDCNQNLVITTSNETHKETIDDRTILLYLAAIESRVQQILPIAKTHRRSNRGGHGQVDETTISWRLDHGYDHPSYSSTRDNTIRHMQQANINLEKIAAMAPPILLNEQDHRTNDNATERLPANIVDSVLQVYDDCIHQLPTNVKHVMPTADGIEANK